MSYEMIRTNILDRMSSSINALEVPKCNEDRIMLLAELFGMLEALNEHDNVKVNFKDLTLEHVDYQDIAANAIIYCKNHPNFTIGNTTELAQALEQACSRSNPKITKQRFMMLCDDIMGILKEKAVVSNKEGELLKDAVVHFTTTRAEILEQIKDIHIKESEL